MINRDRLNRVVEKIKYKLLIRLNLTIRKQRKNPLKIPVIIINFNQLFYLKQLVDFLIIRGFTNIVIIDNKSTYPPLLNYYKDIEDKVMIEYMEDNYGHNVFFENIELQKKYGKGYYILTDADIVPNKDLPKDFMVTLIHYLDKYFKRVTKVGFALRIDDIPDSFPLKEKVLKWEQRFWENPIEDDLYLNWLDTTFSLYKPSYPSRFNNIKKLEAIRVGGCFTALHGGWYLDPNNFSDEQLYYIKTVNSSSSWRINEKGEHLSSEYNKFI